MADETRKIESNKTPAWKIAAVLLIFGIFIYYWGELVQNEDLTQRYKISYSQFREQVTSENVKEVTIKGHQLNGELKRSAPLMVAGEQKPRDVVDFTTNLPIFQSGEILKEFEDKNISINVEPESSSFFWQVIVMLLPWILIIGIWVVVMRRVQQAQGGGAGGLFNFGSSKAKLFDVKKPGVTFKNVAGLENAKKELEETVEFLKDPAKFARLGAKVPKGILLIGPPGTGKTLLARAVAGEAGVPFFSISASEFIEMFVGVGASRVRDMFKRAKEVRPSIIFIDEIDSVGRTRGAGLGGGHDEREQTLNQLLSEMDGFEPHEEIILVAATNRPDVLDPALLRPGRFDRHIIVDKPGWKERKAILDVHTKNKKLAAGIDLDEIARGTPGMTGADLENLANEAALEAVKKGKNEIDIRDFEEARDRILMGTKREEVISGEEKRITAYHEAGHALVSLELPYADPIHKVSIIPRGMAMGVTQFLPVEDRHYYPKRYLINKLSVALAGRAAEKIIFKDVSSGAQDDLKNATFLAEKMVAQWGMSDKVGPINFGRGEEHPFLGRDLTMPKRYSEDMAWLMDQEIRHIIVEAEIKADEVLEKNVKALHNLAEALIKDEVLDRIVVERIIQESKALS
ncbi:MAG: ATP-dependent metallopeptidase FtsH/Yme1/Tma family protein [Deltaproteobacteria bacterium]|nr:ATP-dependent metallopeptidase FtsH/Yme1/Tma family protein [Deltaproteobacteria bacterium]